MIISVKKVMLSECQHVPEWFILFLKKGTQMLKEILKIDGSDMQTRNEVKSQVNDVPAPSSRQDCHGAAVQYRPTKKMGMFNHQLIIQLHLVVTF